MNLPKRSLLAGGLVVGGCLAYICFGRSANALRSLEATSGVPAAACRTADADGAPAIRLVDFGVVPQGARVSRELALANPGQDVISVDRYQSSCDCLTVSSLPLDISPSASGRLRVCVDLGNERDFRGKLAISFSAYESDTVVVAGKALLEVVGPER